MAISKTKDQVVEISVAITKCFRMLCTYGRSEEALRINIATFLEDLEEFTAEQIVWAFTQYRKTNRVVPVTMDIVNMINPPVVWCRDRYNGILRDQKANRFVSKAEEDYVEAFESRNK